MTNEDIQIDQIKSVLDRMSPYLRAEGGDIEFVKFENGVVYIKILGACKDCAMLDYDISEGIEAMILEEVPGVIRVEAIND